jgi:hypothetical protein
MVKPKTKKDRDGKSTKKNRRGLKTLAPDNSTVGVSGPEFRDIYI